MEDTISRQAAIDYIDRAISEWSEDKEIAMDCLRNLPSVQPEYTIEKQESDIDKAMKLVRDARVTILPSAEPEIIRCMDCKHSKHWYSDKARCFLWHETGIDVFEDGFCSYAERKSDEL